MNSKQIIDLNLTAKALKLLEENIGENLCDLELGKTSVDMTFKAQVTKEKKMNWTMSKVKTFGLQMIPS